MNVHIYEGQTVLYWNIVDIFMVCFDFVLEIYIFGVCLPGYTNYMFQRGIEIGYKTGEFSVVVL